MTNEINLYPLYFAIFICIIFLIFIISTENKQIIYLCKKNILFSFVYLVIGIHYVLNYDHSILDWLVGLFIYFIFIYAFLINIISIITRSYSLNICMTLLETLHSIEHLGRIWKIIRFWNLSIITILSPVDNSPKILIDRKFWLAENLIS